MYTPLSEMPNLQIPYTELYLGTCLPIKAERSPFLTITVIPRELSATTMMPLTFLTHEEFFKSHFNAIVFTVISRGGNKELIQPRRIHPSPIHAWS